MLKLSSSGFYGMALWEVKAQSLENTDGQRASEENKQDEISGSSFPTEKVASEGRICAYTSPK